jgi:undecaprenyl-diphosphatase
VVVLYWKRFFQTINFYIKLFVAFLPAAVIGFLLNDYIDQLLERVEVVAVMLILGGIVFLFIDKLFKKTEENEVPEINYTTALKIGFFQTIAMIPGVSRSAATIIGGLTQKLTKKTAAEFSFFLAVPTMAAATGYKLLKFYKDGNGFSSDEIMILLVGNAVAFIVAMLAIKSFIQFLTNNGFKLFGYYRIVLGVIILVLYLSGIKLSV